MRSSPPAPDGGFWGWMAVLGCFMGNVIGDGVMYSFGIFIPYLKDYFGAGSGVTSTIYSLQVGVTFGSGPVASYMTNKLGWRLTTVIGSVLAAAGMGLSALAPNIPFLFFSAGILLGLGLGVIYLPRLDCITQYFDRKRPFVTGLAICGSGLGTFLFAPLTQYLINAVGWKYSMLIMSGICLCNCCFAVCFKPLNSTQPAGEGEEYDQLDQEKKKQDGTGATITTEEKSTWTVMAELLVNPIFMMFAISNFFTSLGYPIPYTFIPDNSKELGMSPGEGAFIISTIGISNTIARLVLGILSQRLNRLFLYNSCLVVCGLCMCMSNFFQPMFAVMAGANCTVLPDINSTVSAATCIGANCTALPDFLSIYQLDINSTVACITNCTSLDVNSTIEAACIANCTLDPDVELHWACSAYVGQLIYAIIYGITSAAYVLLTTLVLADLLGPEMFTNSFGLLLLFQGVATLIGPPIVGFMYDYYGNYDAGFILMGAMISLSGLMLYPVPFVQRHFKRNRDRRNGDDGMTGMTESI